MRVIITGAAGMVGRNLAQRCVSEGWDVLTPRHAELDLIDRAATEAYFQANRPDLVIHAAGLVGGIQANITAPTRFLVENIDIGRNVIMAAHQAGVDKLINLGSSCMYPRDRMTPLAEPEILSGELEPTNEGYAIAKIFAARLCQYLMRESPHLQYKTLIPCNLYGPHDKFSPERSHLIPSIIAKVHQAQKTKLDTVEIWGSGEARREFMYVGDLVEAIIKAAVEIDKLPDLLNIGLGYDYSVNEYYRIVADVVGWDGQFVHDLNRPVGMARKLLNVDQQTAWGWSPKVSIHEGVALTYAFYRQEVEHDG